ncbi:MAG: winged helix DNA-binding domain-containing protein, partial [Actinomycetota bacterium]|nr:winged helix DNA-binding domain-containing protein [Actinomycetota bacterium]
HGYYVLPFLLNEEIVGRVDLKSDREGSALMVQAAWAEPSAPPETAAELAAELELMAGWLGLESVSIAPNGDLAPALSGAVE